MTKINMADPYFNADDREKIHREIDIILDSKLSMGRNVEAFEREFSTRLGVTHAVAMNSCTSTLEAALLAYNVSGREVIIPAETFIATGMAVYLTGATPIFAEISSETFCLDLDDVASRITAKTVGIILVHMGGLITPNILDFRHFCDEQGIFLIEDAAHAPGAEINGREAGSIGHVGCFSFFPTKIITAGEGGMLTTNDDNIAAFARSFQNRGRDMKSKVESYVIPGRNVRMTEITALLGRVQFARLDEFLERRRQLAAIYIRELSEIEGLQLVVPSELKSSSFWKVPVLLNRELDRSKVTEFMAKSGIAVDWAYYPALHMQPVIRELYNTIEGQLPHTEDYLSRHICLPSHPRLTDDDAIFVSTKLKEIIQRELESINTR